MYSPIHYTYAFDSLPHIVVQEDRDVFCSLFDFVDESDEAL